jgi:hypothetical protein
MTDSGQSTGNGGTRADSGGSGGPNVGAGGAGGANAGGSQGSGIAADASSDAPATSDARSDSTTRDAPSDAARAHDAANDSNIEGGAPGFRIVGRTAPGSVGTRFGWPGVAFYARFSGTQASVQLNDGAFQNSFEVVVDGGTPRKFTTVSGQSAYSLATGLAAGTHDLVLWRSTEVFDSGVTELLGLDNFGTGGALLSPPAAPDRRIEVVGDSISVGAGLEGGPAGCAANKTSSDNYFAYGSVAARAVGADVVTIAYSGIGVFRSFNPADPTMPMRYDRAIPSETAAWDFTKYQPHVVVINLGTNDFGAGDPGQPYVDAYVAFVRHIRSGYPGAYFICIAMYGNQETAVGSVVSTLKTGGETRIEQLNFNAVQNNLGCAQHPNAAAQSAMGNLLVTRLRAVMNW